MVSRDATHLTGSNIGLLREIDYCNTLNRAFPDDIRALAWAPAPAPKPGYDTFSARFNAQYRTYRYFFVKRDLDLLKMQKAANKLVGAHDFRNFCKMDAVNVSNFVRTILHFRVEVIDNKDHSIRSAFQDANACTSSTRDNASNAGGQQLCRLEVCGHAFLWHQVRCMAAILFMIGQGDEEPSIVDTFLDVSALPRKPQYNLASELPLMLHDCAFAEVNFRSVG